MSNYTKSTNFAAKDSLPSGNANKVVKGTEINTEFDNIATAITSKADLNSPTLVTPNLGTPSAAVLTNATGLPLTTGVTGTLPVANGGTGATTFSAGALLKGAGTSAITTATAGTDYAAATTGTSAQLLANNGSGGFSNVTVGSGLSLSAGTLSNTASVSAATPTTLGTVYGKTDSGSPYSSFLGYQAGNSTTASGNTAVGYQAGYSNTSGVGHTYMGYLAGYSGTIANLPNVAIGYAAMYTNTTGAANVAVGRDALYTTTGSYNTAVGYQAAYTQTTGTYSVALGYQALYSNNTGGYNVAVGRGALYTTTGSENTAVGQFALNMLTTGINNTAIGTGAGSLINTGSKNTILGAYSGNQDGLDIRTASNYAVISDGDGNRLLSTANGYSLALDGGAVPQSGTGITFPATQSASSDANTLDDYEEGTFTPTARGATTAGTTTYTNQYGYYTKIGRSVTVVILVQWSAMTGTGILTIGGLPFSSANNTQNYASGAVITSDLNWTGGTMMTAFQELNTTDITLVYSSDDGPVDRQLCVNESAQLRITVTYFA